MWKAPIHLLALRALFPKADFGNDEVGWEDEFTNCWGGLKKHGVYTEKYYRGASEILSIGLELLSVDPVGFTRRNPEFFNFTVAVLRGESL
jgi:hypothetical protein